MSTKRRLYRSRNQRMIAGICGGLAEYTGLDPTLLRIGLVIFALLPGPGIIFYLVAWLIIPQEPASLNVHE